MLIYQNYKRIIRISDVINLSDLIDIEITIWTTTMLSCAIYRMESLRNCGIISYINDNFLIYSISFTFRGHASENPRLPESLSRGNHKAVFIGPPGSAMRSLGDKISSTIVAQSADVPTLDWSGSNITSVEHDPKGHVTVPPIAYEKACIKDATDGLTIA